MKRFVSVLCKKQFWGTEIAVVGVDEAAFALASEKARKLGEKVLGGKFYIKTEAVSDAAKVALMEKYNKWYSFVSGAVESNASDAYAEWNLIYPFWRTACWEGDTVVKHGVCVIGN